MPFIFSLSFACLTCLGLIVGDGLILLFGVLFGFIAAHDFICILRGEEQ